MSANLWCKDIPQNFWLCQPDPPAEIWAEACQKALPVLELCQQEQDMDSVTSLTLGEGQFGDGHWTLSSIKRLYYAVKPLLPCRLRHALRRNYKNYSRINFQLRWPVEDRYVCFQHEVARQLLLTLDQSSLAFRYFWPDGQRYAFVLTHDIETGEGQDFVRSVAELEESLGFRSSFNFVPERYQLDIKLMEELRERGFEIGVHGLRHDGKLFDSHHRFLRRADRINQYLSQFGAVGFRSPLMMRNPEWMQALNVDYDLSFFDTDPYEPIPGGVMSIWPFFIGHFVELPYTLPQDSTIYHVFCESTPKIWLDKIDFLEHNHGMGLLNTHPDYLREPKLWEIYVDFLKTMRNREGYWHPLPRQAADWWRRRSEVNDNHVISEIPLGAIRLDNEQITLEPPKVPPGNH